MRKKKTGSGLPSGPIPTRYKLTELFWMLGPAFTRWAESHMHTKGLTPQRLRLMWLLMESGPMMMSALRDEMGVTATTITALVDALEKDKMVRRAAHATDRRATMIAITPKAEKLLTENCGEFRQKVSAIFSPLSQKEQDQFFGLLLKLRQALIKRGVLEDCDLCHGTVKKGSKV